MSHATHEHVPLRRIFLGIAIVDNDAWQRLIDLVQGFNQTEMADQFRTALNQETEHLTFVRRCLTEEINREAGIN